MALSIEPSSLFNLLLREPVVRNEANSKQSHDALTLKLMCQLYMYNCTTFSEIPKKP
ncbi:hypothetical protein [uncultured Winogradskyella sp.]|uniref:hypothetical protein n=1 Tax=uncultured Winogradskyella sp. TaxID=395353 RepID=UPI0030DD32EB